MTALRLDAGVLASVLGTAAFVSPSTAQTRFRATVDTVLVEVSVHHEGRNVSGLEAEDFVVLDKGVPQSVVLLDERVVASHVVIILDRSASVEGDKERALNHAVRRFVDRLRDGDEVALVSFHHHVALEQDLTSDHDLVLRALERSSAGGETALKDAIYAGLSLASRAGGRSALVVFTDGEDTSSVAGDDMIRMLLRDTNAVIYVVASFPTMAEMVSDAGFMRTTQIRSRFMADLRRRLQGRTELVREAANVTGGRVFDLEDDRSLEEAFARINEDMETRYLISFVPRGVSGSGWHELQVTLAEREGDVNARRGYLHP